MKKTKTLELLNSLLWAVDVLGRPTFRNLTDSYESWAYRNGLLQQMMKLEKQCLVESGPRSSSDRVYRLTAQGRVSALGGRDAETEWAREWDGRWRLVMFDVPARENARREKLRRYLRSRHFGFLQNSVWITPNQIETEREHMIGGKVNVESLIFMDARPCAGESDAQIVRGAWDFERINHGYRRYLSVLNQRPRASLNTKASVNALRQWAADEQEAWANALLWDPLLPNRLLSADYLGQKAWGQKLEVCRQAGQQLRTFKL